MRSTTAFLLPLVILLTGVCQTLAYWEKDRQETENPADDDVQCQQDRYCNVLPRYMNWRSTESHISSDEQRLIEAGQGIVRQTDKGPVRGLSVPGNHDTSSFVDVFLGIPYARPPIGQDRFRDPQPVQGQFIGTHDATYYRPACPQMYDVMKEDIPEFEYTNEDCLYLNIYQPNRTNNGHELDKYPVLIFIHGGGFKQGSAIQYPGIVLAQRDMVVVTINYRLGPLGFLSTGNTAIPGNMGLSDQRLAMRWVKRNIHNFAGRPDQVTIVGHEAGAASVGIHMISPITRNEDLFHRAIMMSGSDLSQWAVIPRRQYPEEYARKLSRLVNCGGDPGDAMINCLRTKHPQELVAAAEKVPRRQGETAGPFVPVVDYIEGQYEGWLSAEPKVLRRNLNNIMNIDLLAGFAKDDGAAVVRRNFSHIFTDIHSGASQEEFRQIVENVTRRRGARDENQVSNAIEFLYTWWPNPDNTTARRKMLIDIFTDELYASGVDLAVKSQAKRAEGTEKHTYMYKFDYRSETDNKSTYWMGCYHNYDVQYLFGWPYMNKTYQALASINIDKQYSELDRNISNGTMQLWKEFARSGNPTLVVLSKTIPWNFRNLTWYPMNASNLTYFELDYNSTNEKEYHQSKLGFWQDYIFDILTLEPYTTTPIYPTNYPYQDYQVATFALAGCLFITLIAATAMLIALLRRSNGSNGPNKSYY